MKETALVALAGVAGALTRYGIGTAIGVITFPWATLAINLTGSYLLGLLLALGAARGWPEMAMMPLAVGFIGAFTTFSTFSVEAYALLRSDRFQAAAAYLAMSIVGGVLAAAAGYATARALA